MSRLLLDAMGIAVLAPAVAILAARGEMLGAWLALMGLLVFLAAALGRRTLGTGLGVLIDGRNRLSLDRLQLLAWTILIMSGFFVAVCVNIRTRRPAPLAVDIPAELWALMGIGTTAMVATPLIHNYKKGQAPPAEGLGGAPTGAAAATGVGVASPKPTINRGRLVVNVDPKEARWPDLFTGEEIGQDDHIAIGKLQLAYASSIVAIAYGVALGQVFLAGKPVEGLPTLDNGLITLLSISNVGHLTLKAIPQT